MKNYKNQACVGKLPAYKPGFVTQKTKTINNPPNKARAIDSPTMRAKFAASVGNTKPFVVVKEGFRQGLA